MSKGQDKVFPLTKRSRNCSFLVCESVHDAEEEAVSKNSTETQAVRKEHLPLVRLPPSDKYEPSRSSLLHPPLPLLTQTVRSRTSESRKKESK